MKLLIIGAGSVGTSAAMIIKGQGKDGEWAEKIVVSDYDFDRAQKEAEKMWDTSDSQSGQPSRNA